MLDSSSSHFSPVLEVHDYIGLSETFLTAAANPSVEGSEGVLRDTDLQLDLDLGLRLGSGFTKEKGDGDYNGNQGAPHLDSIHAPNAAGPGSYAVKKWMKRGFSETMAVNSMLAPRNSEVEAGLSKPWPSLKPAIPAWHSRGLDEPENGTPHKSFTSANNSQGSVPEDAPPARDRVVGWPPVRSYRRQTLAKPREMFVKVNMDGITVGRKVDLNAYTSYESLLLALEEMFQPSSSVSGVPQACVRRDGDLKHFLLATGSDFILTYEDKDGDWMLVGDVPWSMFVSTVRRLRITRGSEATGSGTRALGNSRSHP